MINSQFTRLTQQIARLTHITQCRPNTHTHKNTHAYMTMDTQTHKTNQTHAQKDIALSNHDLTS